MNVNILPSDRARLMDVIDPDAYGTGTEVGGWIAAEEYENFLAVIMAGDLGTSATVDAKIEEAKDGSGTGAQDLSGKAITQLTQAGTDSNKQAAINVRQDELSDGFTHIRVSLTVGTASSDAAAALFGFDARYEPETDATTVDEIVE